MWLAVESTDGLAHRKQHVSTVIIFLIVTAVTILVVETCREQEVCVLVSDILISMATGTQITSYQLGFWASLASS